MILQVRTSKEEVIDFVEPLKHRMLVLSHQIACQHRRNAMAKRAVDDRGFLINRRKHVGRISVMTEAERHRTTWQIPIGCTQVGVRTEIIIVDLSELSKPSPGATDKAQLLGHLIFSPEVKVMRRLITDFPCWRLKTRRRYQNRFVSRIIYPTILVPQNAD